MAGTSKEHIDSNALLEQVWKTASTRPGAPVLRMRGQEALSYAGLWALSSEIASGIRERRNDRAPVIVVGEKSALMLASLIACLRSGHAYVPVSLCMPPARIESMADQIESAYGTRPLALMCESQDDARAAGHDPSRFESASSLAGAWRSDASAIAPTAEERAGWVHGEQTQYVIFTSGSTGAPKGIEVTENDVRNFMGWLDGFPVVREGAATFLDQAPYSFDLSEYELVGALSTGGCLYALTPGATSDFKELFAELAESDVNVWVSTPPFADLCLADPSFSQQLLPHLGLFLFCGDTLTHRTAGDLRQRFPRARVANTYGPTESTVAVTYCEITDEMLGSSQPLPVGRPRLGTELRIMRSAGAGEPLTEACPQGESGEIVIIGDTVAKGYLGDSAKTAAAFSEATLSDGRHVRAFRTGDVGHLDADGMLHYEGRMGSLIKLNGFRIELGDVESHLRSLDGVKTAAVVPVRRQGKVRALRAFVLLDDSSSEEAERTPRALKKRLSDVVPSYMVPRIIKVVPSLPLTKNGKIDRKLLAAS